MKKLNLIFVFIFILMFQVSAYAQKDFFSFFGLDSKAEEILELRTETSKTFLNPDETRTSILFNVAIHQLDVNNTWEDIYMRDTLINLSTNTFFLEKRVFFSNTSWYSSSGFVLGRSLYDTGAVYNIARVFLRWDTSPIPNGATIIHSNINFSGGSSQTTPVKYYITRLNKDPGSTAPTNQTTIMNIFDDCFDGSYNPSALQHPTNFMDNAAFQSDLQSHLDSNWMAIGMMNFYETLSRHCLTGVQPSALSVTYSTPSGMILSVDPASLDLTDGNAVTKLLSVRNSGAPGQIEFDVNENSSWLSVSPTSGQTGTTSDNISVTIQANTGSGMRVDTITVTSTTPGVGSPIKKIVVRQPPQATPTLQVSTNSVTISPAGGTSLAINVTNSTSSTPINYYLVYQGGWLFVSADSGNTPSSFTVTAQPNFTGTSRIQQIQVYSRPNQVAGSPQYIYISQAPAKTITLPAQEVSGLQTYLATNWIEANSFLVGSGGNVPSLVLGAGNKITLKPGFTAKSDAGTFRAYIHNFPEEQENYLSGEIGESERNKNTLSMKSEGKDGKTDNTPEQIPTEYDLFQNYPNPFNPTTNIKFALPERSYVTLAVYNLIGQKVAELTNNELEAGYHTIQFNGSMLSSGLYFYRITTNKFSKTYKMLLVK